MSLDWATSRLIWRDATRAGFGRSCYISRPCYGTPATPYVNATGSAGLLRAQVPRLLQVRGELSSQQEVGTNSIMISGGT